MTLQSRSCFSETGKQVAHRAQEYLQRCSGSHDWGHTLRVTSMALAIQKHEGGDALILQLAGLLHDIGRHEEDMSHGKICHAERGAELARDILMNLGCDTELVNQVSACIYTHRFRKNRQPASLEARIIFDADKLDSIGAVGIGRAFLFAGEIGAMLYNYDSANVEDAQAYSSEDTALREYMVKLRFVKDRMLTEYGRTLAERRHECMTEFFEHFQHDIDGEGNMVKVIQEYIHD